MKSIAVLFRTESKGDRKQDRSQPRKVGGHVPWLLELIKLTIMSTLIVLRTFIGDLQK